MADLELIGFSKSFGGVAALKDVTFSCNRGEVHALLGENGAGKSTLLKVLSGAYSADSGEIRIDGRPVSIQNPREAMALGIGTVYQELSLIPDLSVSQNIFLGRIPRNRFGVHRRAALRSMTVDLMQRYGVEGIDPDAVAGELSLSKRQIVEILRVLATDPSIIILDEATSALTENRVLWLLDLARKLAKAGKIVIFISHRMSEVRNACQRLTILRNGSSVATLDMEGVDIDEVISMMIGRQISGYFPEKTPTVQEGIALKVRDLSHSHVLNGVSFSLHDGEVLGVGGLAGQGQAELLLALYGILHAKGGVELHGTAVHPTDARDSLRRGVALVPEDRAKQGLLLDFSIRFNISLPSLGGLRRGPLIDTRRESELADKYIKQLSIKSSGQEQPAAGLSGGNQQKIVLAKILAAKPRLLLLHDITRGVDVGTKKEMFTLVRDFAAQGGAVLFLSTDVEELVNVCDRVMVMHDGQVGAILAGDDLTPDRIIGASIGEHAR
ncbi:MAG: sugar ABC transporter ATP-binding protein [Propionibacteriaceae bacterium]|nr:sugar ABC transporter ATP-binding protein [Propionibacteriaceae bacterium]